MGLPNVGVGRLRLSQESSSPGKRAARSFTRPATQAQSIERGKPVARANQSELVIHGRDGKIRDSDSYGHDPHPPKDKKH